MPNQVFISYARKDQTYVRALADRLRRRGFDVWMDDRIDFGDRWWRTIVRALQESGAFIVVMTPESEHSDWVHREVLLALKQRKPIFPLLLRGKGFPILVDTQYAKVTGGRMPPGHFCDRLRQALSAPEPPESHPSRSTEGNTSEIREQLRARKSELSIVQRALEKLERNGDTSAFKIEEQRQYIRRLRSIIHQLEAKLAAKGDDSG